MSDPQHRTEHVWKDAEALVERVESCARSNANPEEFYEDLVTGLRLTAQASSVSLVIQHGNRLIPLSQSGMTLHPESVADGLRADVPSETDSDLAAVPTSFAAVAEWRSDVAGCILSSKVRMQGERCLQLDLTFDQELELSSRQPLDELAEVLLELALPVAMRAELSTLSRQLSTTSDRDQLIRHLNEGVALTDSFASIASAISLEAEVDRFSLFQRRGNRYRLIATSTQQRVERRARQVRLLERLVELALQHRANFHFTLGSDPDLAPELSDALGAYCHQSGCRELGIRLVINDRSDPVAAYTWEQFHGTPESEETSAAKLDRLRAPLEEAIRGAVRREDAGWGFIASRLAGARSRNVVAWFAGGLAVVSLCATLIPVELTLPVEGRLVAAHQSRLFAPTDGVVDDISVENGTPVKEGELLIQLRSPRLDLEQRTVEGTLATAHARLASLTAMRTRRGSVGTRPDEGVVAADEKVIRKEIEGLEAQLELLREQQQNLRITSPMTGTVDRWDLQKSLRSRPVTHGQYLLDVLADDRCWTVELDIPEDNVNYVLGQQSHGSCFSSFRLRSDPTRTYEGEIHEIADVAHLDPAGDSVVRATIAIESDEEEFRSGATVVARVRCGKHSLGFVTFRSLIEWYRSNRWF